MSIDVPDVAVMPQRGPFVYLGGGFAYGETGVPYFAISMTVADLVSSIKLPNEIPVSRDRPIRIDELFQRERNEERVERDIASYLRRQDELKFFNSLTVALFPLHETADGRIEVADQYSPSRETPAAPSGYEAKSVGQVTVYQKRGDLSHGLISWDPRLTLPVVLDGQHRLASLQAVLRKGAFPGRHEFENSRLSVLLLVLDERAGYRNPQNQTAGRYPPRVRHSEKKTIPSNRLWKLPTVFRPTWLLCGSRCRPRPRAGRSSGTQEQGQSSRRLTPFVNGRMKATRA